MAEWQPIETAPKDGTLVLVVGRNGLAVQASWEWDGDDPTDWDDGSWDYWVNIPGYGMHVFTHWMPLPEPPNG